MSLDPGAIPPQDMDARAWANWCRAQRATRQVDIQTFTPTWSGFSVNPTGDVTFIDLGALVVLLGAPFGTSNSTSMQMLGVGAIDGLVGTVTTATFVLDNGALAVGLAKVSSLSPNAVQFALGENFSGFTAAGLKGWQGPIIFQKVPKRIGGGSNV